MMLKMSHQKRMSTDNINTSYNPISFDHIFENVDPLSEWLQEKENPLLDDEGVLPVDTSDDEMNSGAGFDGGGLSPIDDDDKQSSDEGEIRYSGRYREEYDVDTDSGHFHDKSKFGRNMSHAPSRDRTHRSKLSARSKRKEKVTKKYNFGQRPQRPSEDRFQSEVEGSDLPLHSTNW
ncbi:hypothetical protein HRI_000793800 [Hibiscus trionum]|uniref:Uncharacterized protein n=1 Tax=Hibiscus trionum TaxID=183268 RepID=A0A9W7H8F1_HIBTR|nr:hypothetical protein HRI_000793800 [Hibiscus trionum]